MRWWRWALSVLPCHNGKWEFRSDNRSISTSSCVVLAAVAATAAAVAPTESGNMPLANWNDGNTHSAFDVLTRWQAKRNFFFVSFCGFIATATFRAFHLALQRDQQAQEGKRRAMGLLCCTSFRWNAIMADGRLCICVYIFAYMCLSELKLAANCLKLILHCLYNVRECLVSILILV